jgi:hypothetical protein
MLVRADFLGPFLLAHRMNLVAVLNYERLLVDGDSRARHPQIQVEMEARIGSDLAIHESPARRVERGRSSRQNNAD